MIGKQRNRDSWWGLWRRKWRMCWVRIFFFPKAPPVWVTFYPLAPSFLNSLSMRLWAGSFSEPRCTAYKMGITVFTTYSGWGQRYSWRGSWHVVGSQRMLVVIFYGESHLECECPKKDVKWHKFTPRGIDWYYISPPNPVSWTGNMVMENEARHKNSEFWGEEERKGQPGMLSIDQTLMEGPPGTAFCKEDTLG